MKITSIEVSRFGVWRQLTLPVSGRGVSVFYGPNEAGKTTLWRFIRSILYGFEPFDVDLESGVAQPVRWEGSLQVNVSGAPYSIHRVSDRGTRGLVSVAGTDRQEPAESLLTEILSRTNESLFENVFSVGLNELQELATLQGDEVARHIYGLTLGPAGRRLLDATTALNDHGAALFDLSTRSGRLADLLERDQAVREELEAHRGLREEHAETCAQRARIEKQIETHRRRRSQLERQRSGHRLLERVWPSWNQVREIEDELATIPVLVNFPSRALDRLERLEAELQTAAAARDELVQTVAVHRARHRETRGTRDLHEHASSLVGFVEQAGWYRDASQQAVAARQRAAERQQQLESAVSSLGEGWSLGRIERIDTGPAAHRRMLAAADRYRSALRRRNRMARRQKFLNRAVRKRAADLDERLKPLNGVALEEAITAQQTRVGQLEELRQLKRREQDLLNCQRNLTGGAILHETHELPPWIVKFLLLLAGCGVLMTIMGIYQAAAAVDVVAGAGLAFIGLTGLGLAWGFKKHRDGQAEVEIDHAQAGQSLESQLRETTEAIAQFHAIVGTASEAAASDADHSPTAGDEHTHRVHQASARLGELQRWGRAKRSIHVRRKRLSELRTRFQSVQRSLSSERQNWCLLQQEVGLPESVQVGAALDTWHRLSEAREHLRHSKGVAAEAEQLERQLESFRTRMLETARRAGRTGCDQVPPLELLATWGRELESLGAAREDRRRSYRELMQHRRKRDQARRHVQRVRLRRLTMFAKGGARHRDEFLERAGWVNRRAECDELLIAAKEELRLAGESEPDLAVVEDDLVQFNFDENREKIDAIAGDLEQIERDLQTGYEELGSVKHSLKALEANCEASHLRFEASQSRHELKRAAEEWFGQALARQALRRVRSKFERTCQPAVLASASRYLERLTRGRYRNIWTPLGERELRIDDERGHTLSVEQLSGGTREQLFLAVRMAAVRELAQQGVELPMVFDDVLVNFDQSRTEAAVDALLEFAEQNQQVLFFTCHLHLAHLFEARGIEPVWLPGHNVPQQERRAG